MIKELSSHGHWATWLSEVHEVAWLPRYKTKVQTAPLVHSYKDERLNRNLHVCVVCVYVSARARLCCKAVLMNDSWSNLLPCVNICLRLPYFIALRYFGAKCLSHALSLKMFSSFQELGENLIHICTYVCLYIYL